LISVVSPPANATAPHAAVSPPHVAINPPYASEDAPYAAVTNTYHGDNAPHDKGCYAYSSVNADQASANAPNLVNEEVE